MYWIIERWRFGSESAYFAGDNPTKAARYANRKWNAYTESDKLKRVRFELVYTDYDGDDIDELLKSPLRRVHDYIGEKYYVCAYCCMGEDEQEIKATNNMDAARSAAEWWESVKDNADWDECYVTRCKTMLNEYTLTEVPDFSEYSWFMTIYERDEQ